MAEYYPQTDPRMQPPQNSTLAIISLVSGIASFIILPFLGGLAAVITGHMAKREIRDSGGRLGGDGLATGGLILGYINLGLTVLCICGFILLVSVFSVQPGDYMWR